MRYDVLGVLREVEGKLERKDPSSGTAEDDCLLEAHGANHGKHVSRLLGWTQPLAVGRLARRHLAPIKGRHGESVRQLCHEAIVLKAMTIASRDKQDQRTLALVPVMNATPLGVENIAGRVEFHDG